MLRTNDLYWLAGLVEGEGCFRMDASKYKYRSPRIVVKMTDRDVVERAAGIFNSKVRNIKLAPAEVAKGYKPQFVTEVGGRRAAGWMMTLYSLLGNRRKGKIHEILTEWREIKLDHPEKARGGHARRRN